MSEQSKPKKMAGIGCLVVVVGFAGAIWTASHLTDLFNPEGKRQRAAHQLCSDAAKAKQGGSWLALDHTVTKEGDAYVVRWRAATCRVDLQSGATHMSWDDQPKLDEYGFPVKEKK